MRVAIIHDWLRVNAGSEKVVKELILIYKPDCSLYTLFSKLPLIDRVSVIQKIPVYVTILHYVPFISNLYKYLLPLFPIFIKSVHPRGADVYISSSHAVAKGFSKTKGIPHICYCHTPMRYIWYMHQDYLKDANGLKSMFLKLFIPLLRRWDVKTAGKVDFFIANSQHIREQIQIHYQKDAVVIYPPVEVDKFTLNENPRKDFYLAVGRFVPYKKIDVVIQAFTQMPDKKLVLIGDGYDAIRIKKIIADHPNIVWLGYQHDDELLLYMQNAKACIFAAKEDFGIMCVEAQATGTPVLALNYGGYQETVIEGETGYFFDEQTTASIQNAVNKFEQAPLTHFSRIRENAVRFSAARFRNEISEYVQSCIKKYSDSSHG
ncbi:MAG: glycosyltransferase [Chitinophagaceae bacterium]|nr:glycosyltransferase [Chitinophagaceae bacterium]